VIGPRNPYWENALVGNAHGVGVSLERRSANGLSGWLSYSRDRAVQTDRARGEAFPSDYDQRHTLNGYALYRRSSRTSLSTRLRVGSNFPLPGYYQRVGEDYYLADARNAERLPVYGRLDVRGDRTFTYRRSRLTLFAEVVNVMNRRNLRAADPSVSLTTGLARFAVEEMFPVLPSLGVLLEF
jgi:hypothetical protein